MAVNRGRDKEALARSPGALDYIDSEVGDPAQALQAMGGAKAIIATVTKAGMLDEIQTKNILLGIAPLLPTNNRRFGPLLVLTVNAETIHLRQLSEAFRKTHVRREPYSR